MVHIGEKTENLVTIGLAIIQTILLAKQCQEYPIVATASIKRRRIVIFSKTHS